MFSWPKYGPGSSSHAGMVTIASSELTTTSEMTYSSLPSRTNVQGSMGARGDRQLKTMG